MTPTFLALLWLAEEGGGAGPFSVNFGLIFWTWVVFLGLLFALSRFAWPAIVNATAEREERVRKQLADAERMNSEAKTLLEEQRKLTADARSEAQTLLAEAKGAAEKERAQSLEKIRRDQEALMDRARRDIASERDKAIADLRREAVDLALGAASKVVGQRLDGEADRKIVLDYITTVERGVGR